MTYSSRVSAKHWLLLLAALLLALPHGAAAADTSQADDFREVDVRVVSYNMHTGIGADGQLSLERMAGVLADLDADVIGLQEVDVHWSGRSQWRDQARELAEILEMRVFFAPIYSFEPTNEGSPRREYGLALLTDLPVVHTENHSITRLSTQGPDPVPAPAPGFPELVVEADGARLHVYGTHLDYRGDPSVREAQVADMLDILGDDPEDAQQVLLGDFNAGPAAPELAPLWRTLVDSWAVAGRGDGHTYPTSDPTKRIDYVTHSTNIKTRHAEVPTTPASDHLPVVADLILRRGA